MLVERILQLLAFSRVIAMTVRVFMIVLLFTLPALLFGQEAEEKERVIDLGGPRQARAVINVTDGEYRVRVRLLPVRTFDEATNAELNREKARVLALQALARHLSDAREVHLTVKGARLATPGMDGRFYTLTLRIPRKGVVVARGEKKSPPEAGADRPTQITFDSALFTRKRDYLQTIDLLAASLQSELQAVEQRASPKDKTEAFRAAMARIRARAAADFGKLRAEIKGDLLLSSVLDEPGDLTRTIDVRLRALEAALDRAARRQEARQKKEDKP